MPTTMDQPAQRTSDARADRRRVPTGAHDPMAALRRWGPDADPDAPPPSPAEAAAYVRALTTSHYENFSVLSRLVPADLRDDFAAVYAFCRWSDDLADETGAGAAARERSLELLGWWRAQLRDCVAYARAGEDGGASRDASMGGGPRHPVFVALAATIRARRLSDEPFHHLIDAFEQDQRITRYRTWDELLGYCALSANPVGRIVLALAGHDGSKPGDDERIAMSDATCTALQLTNFWQDVRRDIEERDRVYMPEEETGVDFLTLRAWMYRDDPAARAPFIHALRPLVERTRALFVRGRPLVRTLDRRIRPVVWLFGAGGERVLTKVERVGCATLWERPALTKIEKAGLAARASLGLYPGAGAGPGAGA